LAFAFVYLTSLLGSAAGFASIARWLFIATATAHYVLFNLAAGHAAGAPFWMVPAAAYPAVAFTRAEQRQAALSYTLLVVVFVGTEVLTHRYGPLVLDPQRAAVAYYFQLIGSAVLLGWGLHYYKNATVKARTDLDLAKQRIADLLANMLPPSIATRLE